MSTKYSTYIKGLALCLVTAVVILGLMHISTVKAQSSSTASVPLFGWGWSSTIGHISFNSANTGAGDATDPSYSVVKQYTGDLSGFAWSPNIGWIKFGGLSGFPTNGTTAGNAKVGASSITGWARACAGTIKFGDSPTLPVYPGDCSTMTSRSDGWDGWIELSGVNHTLGYNPTTGVIDGFAWGGDVVGWLRMNLVASSTPTTTPAPLYCSISNQLKQGTTHTITWTSNSSYCYGTSAPSGPFTVNAPNGSIDIPTPSATTIYNLNCNKESGGQQFWCGSTTITVGDGTSGTSTCTSNCGTGEPGIKMWLDNDINEAKDTIRIRKGQSAKVNWKKNDSTSYSICRAAVNTDFLNPFDNSEDLSGHPHIIPSSMMTVGENIFSMNCSPATDPTSSIPGKTSSQSSRPLTTTLIIYVIDPTIEER